MILNGTKWIIYHLQLHQCYGNTEMRYRNLQDSGSHVNQGGRHPTARVGWGEKGPGSQLWVPPPRRTTDCAILTPSSHTFLWDETNASITKGCWVNSMIRHIKYTAKMSSHIVSTQKKQTPKQKVCCYNYYHVNKSNPHNLLRWWNIPGKVLCCANILPFCVTLMMREILQM